MVSSEGCTTDVDHQTKIRLPYSQINIHQRTLLWFRIVRWFIVSTFRRIFTFLVSAVIAAVSRLWSLFRRNIRRFKCCWGCICNKSNLVNEREPIVSTVRWTICFLVPSKPFLSAQDLFTVLFEKRMNIV